MDVPPGRDANPRVSGEEATKKARDEPYEEPTAGTAPAPSPAPPPPPFPFLRPPPPPYTYTYAVPEADRDRPCPFPCSICRRKGRQ